MVFFRAIEFKAVECRSTVSRAISVSCVLGHSLPPHPLWPIHSEQIKSSPAFPFSCFAQCRRWSSHLPPPRHGGVQAVGPLREPAFSFFAHAVGGHRELASHALRGNIEDIAHFKKTGNHVAVIRLHPGHCVLIELVLVGTPECGGGFPPARERRHGILENREEKPLLWRPLSRRIGLCGYDKQRAKTPSSGCSCCVGVPHTPSAPSRTSSRPPFDGALYHIR